jgi:hypothetical protein
MRYIPLIIAFILSLFFISCEEEIPWETKEVDKILVVEGAFTNEYKQHKLYLTKTADYFKDRKTPAVTGADVYLTSGLDTVEYIEVPDTLGVYKTKNRVSGVVGSMYNLHIHLQEPIRGETYYYASEKMVNGLTLEAFNASLYKNPLYQGGSNVTFDSLMMVATLYGKEPKEIRNYYMVKLHEYSDNSEDTIINVNIYPDDQEFEGEHKNTLFFYESFAPGDTVQIEISAVSKQYYDFVDGINKLATQETDQFFDMSGPPANAEGNIQGAEALGYFRVSKVTKAISIVHRNMDNITGKKPGNKKLH